MRSGTEQSSTKLTRHQATVRIDPMFENRCKLSVRPMLGPLHVGLRRAKQSQGTEHALAGWLEHEMF